MILLILIACENRKGEWSIEMHELLKSPYNFNSLQNDIKHEGHKRSFVDMIAPDDFRSLVRHIARVSTPARERESNNYRHGTGM